ncbi:MAG TPA: STAS domain-containing protein [Cytophagaceae bacterium]
MKLTSDKDSNYYVISIEGDVDASSCIMLDKAIAEAVSKGENKILIDCTHLNYISSAGLGVFMSYIQDFESNNISLVLFNLSAKVKNVFQILGLDELIKIVSSKEEAKALIG